MARKKLIANILRTKSSHRIEPIEPKDETIQ